MQPRHIEKGTRNGLNRRRFLLAATPLRNTAKEIVDTLLPGRWAAIAGNISEASAGVPAPRQTVRAYCRLTVKLQNGPAVNSCRAGDAFWLRPPAVLMREASLL